MAKLLPAKMDINSINGGNEYTNADGLQAKTINAVVASGAWVQKLGENTPDTSKANQVGTPTVSIDNSSGTPKFVFANLKGATGEKGDKGDTGEKGDTYALTADDKTAIAQIVYGMLPFYEGETS